MLVTLADGLRALDEATDSAATIRVDLDDCYRRLIALTEALPSNEPLADKSWVARMDGAFTLHYRRVRRA